MFHRKESQGRHGSVNKKLNGDNVSDGDLPLIERRSRIQTHEALDHAISARSLEKFLQPSKAFYDVVGLFRRRFRDMEF